MRWSQKLFGVSMHLDRLENGRKSGFEVKPEEFDVPDSSILENGMFAGRLKHMSILAEDYAQQAGKGLVPHNHRKTGKLIMSGAVRNQAGLRFEQQGEIWWCKLPNRAAFTKWRQCEVGKANRHTQRFIMFYLAREGAEYENYRNYPFDRFSDIDSAEELADFLNGLASSN